jgi:hypothetical protein
MKSQRHDPCRMMHVRAASTSILSLALALTMLSGFSFAQQANKPLTNDDVASMVKSSLPEEVILNAIQANETNFDTSASALIALQKGGVDSKVMNAMLAAAANKKNPPTVQTTVPGQPAGVAGGANTSAVPASAGLAQFGAAIKAMMGGGIPGTSPPGGGITGPGRVTTAPLPAAAMPVVACVEGNSRKDLVAEHTFVAQTKSKANSLKTIAVDSAAKSAFQAGVNQVWYSTITHLGSGFAGSMASDAMVQSSGDISSGILAHHFKPSQKYIWALSGLNSRLITSSNRPGFDLNYAGLPGINPDEFEPAIVKLSPSNNAWRLVGATDAKSDTVLNVAAEWEVYSSFIEDRQPASVTKVASGHAQISPGAALTPGEYAVVLRPVSKNKKFSGAEVAQGQGPGLLFNSAWSFTVK